MHAHPWERAAGMLRMPLLVAAALVLPGVSQAQTTVNLGTAGNAGAFLLSGTGSASFRASQAGSGIGILSGAEAFTGLWSADEIFTIPAGATNVSLSFSGLTFDGRGVLQLNGKTFKSDSSTVTSGFRIGGSNDLRLVLNHPGKKPPSANRLERTSATLIATLTYTPAPDHPTPVSPAPSPLILAMMGAICVASYLVRRREIAVASPTKSFRIWPVR